MAIQIAVLVLAIILVGLLPLHFGVFRAKPIRPQLSLSTFLLLFTFACLTAPFWPAVPRLLKWCVTKPATTRPLTTTPTLTTRTLTTQLSTSVNYKRMDENYNTTSTSTELRPQARDSFMVARLILIAAALVLIVLAPVQFRDGQPTSVVVHFWRSIVRCRLWPLLATLLRKTVIVMLNASR